MQPRDPVTGAIMLPSGLYNAHADFKGRLTRFYRHYNPAKLVVVDEMLKAARGHEEEMFKALRARYGPEPDHPTSAPSGPSTNLHHRLRLFYQHYAPDKLHTIPDTLKAYRGQEEQLMKVLENKYGPEPVEAPMRVPDEVAQMIEGKMELRKTRQQQMVRVLEANTQAKLRRSYYYHWLEWVWWKRNAALVGKVVAKGNSGVLVEQQVNQQLREQLDFLKLQLLEKEREAEEGWDAQTATSASTPPPPPPQLPHISQFSPGEHLMQESEGSFYQPPPPDPPSVLRSRFSSRTASPVVQPAPDALTQHLLRTHPLVAGNAALRSALWLNGPGEEGGGGGGVSTSPPHLPSSLPSPAGSERRGLSTKISFREALVPNTEHILQSAHTTPPRQAPNRASHPQLLPSPQRPNIARETPKQYTEDSMQYPEKQVGVSLGGAMNYVNPDEVGGLYQEYPGQRQNQQNQKQNQQQQAPIDHRMPDAAQYVSPEESGLYQEYPGQRQNQKQNQQQQVPGHRIPDAAQYASPTEESGLYQEYPGQRQNQKNRPVPIGQTTPEAGHSQMYSRPGQAGLYQEHLGQHAPYPEGMGVGVGAGADIVEMHHLYHGWNSPPPAGQEQVVPQQDLHIHLEGLSGGGGAERGSSRKLTKTQKDLIVNDLVNELTQQRREQRRRKRR